MPRYAYIPYQSDYEKVLQHVDVDEFQGNKVFRVDSTELTEQDYDVIRNQLKETCYCYSCETQMIFRRPKDRNNHFAHLTRNNCFQAEGLAHSAVKKDLFQRFQQRGYHVLMERAFRANNKQVRTDVAVLYQQDILAIEVQASPSIKRSTVAERTNTYSAAIIPTAWIIVLNSFFGEGKYTSLSENVLVENEDGTKTYKKQMIPFDKPTPFFILADIPNSFHLLMDSYKYVVSVNHDGHFFLIREKDFAVKEEYEVYRIEQDKVVDVLLATEVLNIDYVPDKKAATEQPDAELEHNEGKHQPAQWAGEKFLNIDFKKAYEEEQEQLQHEEAINILAVVKETKNRERFDIKKQQVMQSLNVELIELQNQQEYIQSVSERRQAEIRRQEKLLKEKDRLEKSEKAEILSTIQEYKEMDPYFYELISGWEAKSNLEEMQAHRLKKAVEYLEKQKTKVAVKVVRETYAELSEIIGSIPNVHPTAVAQQFVNVMRRKESPPKNPNDLYIKVNGELNIRKRYKELLQALMFHKEKMIIVAEYYFWWENISLQEKSEIKSERYRQAMK
ncbi:hypothetical protein IOC57_19355 [Bacillus sp. SD075]|uniref:competence protein CoiA family protein n=1 Tax=Bacillus sp. SD075 TaxID=2781732 RepID=UPI001A97222E|nr:competence protein CoiA family protein [Bacillus sp. SD075]MBO0999891.1 hypothetical protein [Bacillus sp. SD075]